jgi:integrase
MPCGSWSPPPSPTPDPTTPRRPRLLASARRILANQHVIPALGARKLSELSAEDVDRWLADKAQTLSTSTSTLQSIRSILSRALARAQARDKVKRNVVLLCATPTGKIDRPSKALSLTEAESLLHAAEGSTMGTYVVLSLLTGARTEELRALTWTHVDLDGDTHAAPPGPPHIMVWRSVRAAATPRPGSRAAPWPCLSAASANYVRTEPARQRRDASPETVGRTTTSSAPPKPAHPWTRRTCDAASDSGVPIEQISRLVGHRRSHSLSHAADSSNDERPGRKLSERLTRSFVVGDTGIEPVTSSVSRAIRRVSC